MKRLMDIVISAGALFVLAPVIIVIGLLVCLKLGWPPLFSQRRPGLMGKPFTMYKFRSMSTKKDGFGQLLPDAERLTSFGRFLRATSLDELPELWNVLKGEMSLVGPRPLLMEYLPLYSPTQARRHQVRPGITGWAQINGRNTLSWEEKFDLDVWYVDNRSLCLDMKIILMTVKKVFKSDGINADGCATMTRFTGK
ncbi:MAG: sugar transferase [Proteobacteria bacterium]|nr:sugar transferase [Pseudomonadota bacterium]